MLGLFALIGIVVAVIYLAKAMNWLGDLLVAWGDSITYRAEVARRQPRPLESVDRHNKNIADEIETFSGEVSDVAYRHQIRKEIDDLTR
jgi:hypothetical protein